jgi:integrase/recombinase XerD
LAEESEVAFMPEQIAKRLHDYIQQENLSADDRLFPICYSTARAAIRRIGKRLNVVLTPQFLPELVIFVNLLLMLHFTWQSMT